MVYDPLEGCCHDKEFAEITDSNHRFKYRLLLEEAKRLWNTIKEYEAQRDGVIQPDGKGRHTTISATMESILNKHEKLGELLDHA